MLSMFALYLLIIFINYCKRENKFPSCLLRREQKRKDCKELNVVYITAVHYINYICCGEYYSLGLP